MIRKYCVLFALHSSPLLLKLRILSLGLYHTKLAEVEPLYINKQNNYFIPAVTLLDRAFCVSCRICLAVKISNCL